MANESYRVVRTMARRYSQCRLPAMSDEDEHTTTKQFPSTQGSYDTPIQEIRDIQMDKALFTDIFDKYFDESKEGDIDESEFKKGLLKLGYNSTEDNIHKLFNVLLLTDNEHHSNDGYLQNEQFCEFLTTKYTNHQLCEFQTLLLSLIKNAIKIPIKPRTENTDEMEMRAAIQAMMNNELSKNVSLWTNSEIANWLHTINMKRYIPSFTQQCIDGSILLNDIAYDNLISDLQIKSIHAPKLMREINKLRNGNDTNLMCDYNVSNVHILSERDTVMSELRTQIDTLKNDLSETRTKLIQTKASNHLRQTSAVSQYSEGNIHTNHRGKDSEYIQTLEHKNKELTELFLRADNNLKKYTRAIVPFQERISNLERQNQTRKATIDRLNKRVQRRNESIAQLRNQLERGRNNNCYVKTTVPSMRNAASAGQIFESGIIKGKRGYNSNVRKKYRPGSVYGLSNAGNGQIYMNRSKNGYVSRKSVAGMKSAPTHRRIQSEQFNGNGNANVNIETDNESVISSLTSMAYGYIIGGNVTARN